MMFYKDSLKILDSLIKKLNNKLNSKLSNYPDLDRGHIDIVIENFKSSLERSTKISSNYTFIKENIPIFFYYLDSIIKILSTNRNSNSMDKFENDVNGLSCFSKLIGQRRRR